MSADKHKSLGRRIKLLRRAVGCYSWYRIGWRLGYISIADLERKEGPLSGGLYFHCEGGVGMDNPDVQRLIDDGHLGPLRRGSPPKKFSDKFLRFFEWKNWDGSISKNGGHIHGHALRSYRPVTADGIAFLKANDDKFPYEKWRYY